MAERFGRRIRRGVKGTAVAAAAMAALTASQSHGLTADASGPADTVSPPEPLISGGSPYHTELPPLVDPGKRAAGTDTVRSASDGRGSGAIPTTVLDAYQQAEAALAKSHPLCHLRWELLAAIGQVESGQARGGRVDADGTTASPILGPQLNGNGYAAIHDTDAGAWDGDRSFDRAVGPMQFIPSTWAVWGADNNGDGTEDPNNIYDAALAAGRYLCADGRDLSDPHDLDRAILGYNQSQAYLATVKSWYTYFRSGYRTVPDTTDTGHARTPAPSPTTPRATPSPSAAPSTPNTSRPSSGPTSPAGKPKPTEERPDDHKSEGSLQGLPDSDLPTAKPTATATDRLPQLP
ncbi:hypothetical protein ABZW18_10835 [Streptomyces sp. NPDC004647]|uniref:lytic transglycosylase domain-containing protein n=1 Tax=Streptomyces sp. NPDC004647 TaxID=3154671 RepID=UPI0033ABF488